MGTWTTRQLENMLGNKELAEFCGVSPSAVTNWINRGVAEPDVWLANRTPFWTRASARRIRKERGYE